MNAVEFDRYVQDPEAIPAEAVGEPPRENERHGLRLAGRELHRDGELGER